MKKYVVLSFNENPIYMYWYPLVCWAWAKFDWRTVTFYARNERSEKLTKREALVQSLVHETTNDLYVIPDMPYKSETVAQVSRLYGALHSGDERDILMTTDVDMIPLSNYWNPSDLNVTCYGRDLTDYHYPICYCAMTTRKWIEVMLMTDRDPRKCIIEDLEERPKNTNPWLWDQDILTERLNRYGKKLLHLVPRGTDKRTGYPTGRVDRSNWTLDHRQFIDCHAPHDVLTNEGSFHKLMQLLHTVWPTQDWKWYIEYHREFKKLL